MSENRGRHQIVCFVVVFSAQVKILKGLFTCTDKNEHHHVTPQTSSYPGNGNDRPGICSSSPPPHGAKQDKRGPLILRYNQTNFTLTSIPELKVEGCFFYCAFMCLSSICRVFLHLHGGSH